MPGGQGRLVEVRGARGPQDVRLVQIGGSGDQPGRGVVAQEQAGGHQERPYPGQDLDEHPGDEQYPGVVVLRLDGGLFFATSDALEDRVREVALSTSGITGIVLDCEGIDFIDSQGSAKLREVLGLARQAGITLRLARVKPAVHDLLACDGVLDDIGAENIHGNIDHAVTAQLATTGDSHADL